MVSEEVRLPKPLADEMIEHCKVGRPNEACGILAARDGEIVKVFPMTNADASSVRYSLDPQEQFVVYRALDEKEWELGGVYHSHTRTAAYPSPTDVRLASEDVPYVIVALATDPPDIRAFRITKENWDAATGNVIEVPVAIVP